MTNPDPKPLPSLEEFLAEVKAPAVQLIEAEALDPVPGKPVAGLMARANMERIVELSGTKCLCSNCRRLAKELKRELKRRKI